MFGVNTKIERQNKTFLIINELYVLQPRRVAAVTIASHVANAFNSSVGGLVGYTVRFEDATSADTKIKFLTDGMLLREAMLGKRECTKQKLNIEVNSFKVHQMNPMFWHFLPVLILPHIFSEVFPISLSAQQKLF